MKYALLAFFALSLASCSTSKQTAVKEYMVITNFADTVVVESNYMEYDGDFIFFGKDGKERVFYTPSQVIQTK